MLKEGHPVGAIAITRTDPGLFPQRQIEFLQTFADQAVIALNNVRLFDEVQARARDLREALDQQIATAEVLQVINSSPGDLAPVFEAMLDKAMTLCGAAFGFLTSYDGRRFMPMAMRGVPPPLAEYFSRGMDQPGPGEAHFRILQGEDVIHNVDQKDEEAYRSGLPLRRAVVDFGGARTALVIALRKDDAVLGALTIYRKEVRPFSDKQIALMRNFAAQAVVAIENARLLSEQREALEQQKATSEVLGVISSSPKSWNRSFAASFRTPSGSVAPSSATCSCMKTMPSASPPCMARRPPMPRPGASSPCSPLRVGRICLSPASPPRGRSCTFPILPRSAPISRATAGT